MRRPLAKILTVDDEPFNRDILEQELADLGYQTICATSGQEALAKVAAEAPDVILLDVVMPGMDRFTVCRILKTQEETQLIPIIMTALGQVEDRIQGIQAGADDFLTKPVNREELVARIRTSLRLKHAIEHKVGALQSAQAHLLKFVPRSVKRLVAENPQLPVLEKRETDVSVLFSVGTRS